MLNAFNAVNRHVGLNGDALNFVVVGFQSARGADETAACANGGDKVRDASVGLFPEFNACCVEMGLPNSRRCCTGRRKNTCRDFGREVLALCELHHRLIPPPA